MSRPHPAPPAFPTRRSSDLSLSMDGKKRNQTMGIFPLAGKGNKAIVFIIADLIRSFHSIKKGRKDRRSEEHTSELQSRENLVCRLRLERKTVTDGVRCSPRR